MQDTVASEFFSDSNIVDLRNQMLRFATIQLRDDTLAEDAVQDALLAAHQAREKFEGRAQLKTWVFAILRNKILDVFRERKRRPLESLTQDDGSDDEIESLFDGRGHWSKDEQPSDWGQPDTSLSNDQFWVVLEICLNNMKESVSRVFMMREFLGLDTEEICEELKITESNCWVTLHRARSRLRLCLEDKWFKVE